MAHQNKSVKTKRFSLRKCALHPGKASELGNGTDDIRPHPPYYVLFIQQGGRTFCIFDQKGTTCRSDAFN